ncbi:hypothetical protein [Cypionkella sp. TWP1-2-1b2]
MPQPFPPLAPQEAVHSRICAQVIEALPLGELSVMLLIGLALLLA